MKKRCLQSMARLLLLGMLLSVSATLPLGIGAAEARLTTDKTTYAVGEPILVTATGSGKDWVGIYPADAVYGTGNDPSIIWYYVAGDGNSSGTAKDIYTAEYNNYANWPELNGSIPAGDYQILLFENDGYTLLDSVNITITDAPPEGDWGLSEEKPLVTDKTEYKEGDPIYVKALGSGKDWVGLYCAGETPPTGMPVSIYWFYVEENGHAAGDTVNLREERFNPDREEYGDIPAGEYRLVLCTDDSYTVKYEVAITVKADPSQKPATVTATYQSANAGKGRADGKLTITADGTAPKSYVIRWANADGAIKDYTDVATVTCTGAETVFEMTPNTLIPMGADRLLVYAKTSEGLSKEPAVAKLPAGAGNYELGTVRQELQVMSDIHLNSDASHPYNQHFTAALREISKFSPHTLGVFINGDVADQGLAANYVAYQNILKTAGKDLNVIAAIGNHDFYGPTHGGPAMTDAERIAQFLKGTNNDSETVYFDRWIDGTHFIFLGSEAYLPPNAQLSDTQLAWLEETLEKDKAEGRPVFLFLHEGIVNTVAGTFEYQGWHGIWQGEKLREILSDHPEVVMFSGHSHWVLESPVSFLPTDGKKASHLNTASCAYLWDDDANKTNVGINGSQGYYIYIYDDCIVFRGRSFSSGQWISTAQFVMDWDSKGAFLPEPGESETETGTDTAPAPDVTGESDTAAPTPDSNPAESTTVAETPAATQPGTDAPKERGCASAISALALIACLPAVAVTFLRKRKE